VLARGADVVHRDTIDEELSYPCPSLFTMRRVERTETAVMFVAAADGSDEIAPAWDRLEAAIGSLRGRHFLGAFDDTGVYRCCVRTRAGDDPAALGLQEGVIPGGL
jgi:hypothetical protein